MRVSISRIKVSSRVFKRYCSILPCARQCTRRLFLQYGQGPHQRYGYPWTDRKQMRQLRAVHFSRPTTVPMLCLERNSFIVCCCPCCFISLRLASRADSDVTYMQLLRLLPHNRPYTARNQRTCRPDQRRHNHQRDMLQLELQHLLG